MSDVIFNEELFEKVISQIQVNALSLNESDLNSRFNKYPKQVFNPLNDYLQESFMKGLIAKKDAFVKSFTKGAKEIAQRISKAVKEFSFKKVFMTVSKMMQKIKAGILKQFMILFSPLRKVIIENGFCDEKNKFQTKATFAKLVEVAKSAGKEIGAEKILSPEVVTSISKNVNLAGTESLREADREVATFDERDVKYMDFFQKMMFNLGIEDAKLNGFFSQLAKKITTGAAIAGIFSLVGALLPSMAIISSIAAAAGAAVAAAPVLVMIIGAIIFGIGLFMFATWLLKPYPTVKDCEAFLATIFSGSHPFDFPEATMGEIENTAQPIDQIKKPKPVFNDELIVNFYEEGIDQEEPEEGDVEDVKDLVKKYDDLDIDEVESEANIEEHKRLIRRFVRNVFPAEKREKLAEFLRDEVEDDNEYAEYLEDLLSVINDCFLVNKEFLDEDGEKIFPFALNSKSVQTFLTDKQNSAKDRLTKVIDVVDNFVDRVDKYYSKEKSSL
jgi:hypothetical protein